ncbi:MAG: signal peptidase I [Planctomycetota bacterium]|nr:signal peptidase I [Planctomycetota bacterium]
MPAVRRIFTLNLAVEQAAAAAAQAARRSDAGAVKNQRVSEYLAVDLAAPSFYFSVMSKNGSAAPSPAAVEDRKKPVSKWREIWDLFGCIAVAVALALLIKRLLLEPFVIPSGSMEPTLHGRPDGGDRVLCTKWSYNLLGYHRRDPQRWEIFVFKYPAEHPEYRGQSFIKRCIGLPGERIILRGGDIWVTALPGQRPALQTKPDKVQRDLWIPVYEEDFADISLTELAYFWNISGKAEIDGGVLRLAAGAALDYRPLVRAGEEMVVLPFVPDRYALRQAVDFVCGCGGEAAKLGKGNLCSAVRGRFRRTIWNQKFVGRCPRCGAYLLENSVVYYGRRSDLPQQMTPVASYRQGEADKLRRDRYHAVKDLRFLAKCRLAAGAALRIVLKAEPRQSIAAVLRAGVPGNFSFYGDNREHVEQRRDIPCPPERWLTVEMCRVDGVARFFLAAEQAERWQAEIPLAAVHGAEAMDLRNTGVRLEALEGEVALDDLRLDRDIYYYGRYDSEDDAFEVNADQFLALGDNCPASNDSRNWGMVPRQNLCGPAVLIWWPPHRLRWLAQP